MFFKSFKLIFSNNKPTLFLEYIHAAASTASIIDSVTYVDKHDNMHRTQYYCGRYGTVPPCVINMN